MNVFLRLLDSIFGRIGYQIAPRDQFQVIPETVPDPELYAGPEDFNRLYRPWLSKQFDEFFTEQVLNNTMLSRKKLYVLLQLFRQTLTTPGDVFEAGVGSGGSARLMLDTTRRENRH